MLNIKKCSVMVFHRGSNANFEANYYIGNIQLEKLTEIKDLGIMIDNKLNFNKRVIMWYEKRKRFWVVSQDSVMILFKKYDPDMALHHISTPMLEYGSVVWSSHYAVHTLGD